MLDRLRRICLALPDAHEEPAWVGIRWRVRTRTFAHVVPLRDGKPASHARAAGTPGPATVLTFRAPDEEVDALRSMGHPYFLGGWGREVVGIHLDERTDWDEVGELLVESYCLLAPRKLVALVERP